MTPGPTSTTRASSPIEVGQAKIDPLFLAEVSTEQRALYPTLLANEDQHMKSRGEANPQRWVYFSPLHHAEGGLLSQDLIDNLRNGSDLLIVGAGLGDIERYLIKGRGIDPRRITAADIDIQDYPNDLGVQPIQTNMLTSWPFDHERYRYILIPEALGMAVSWTSGDLAVDENKVPIDQIPEVLRIAKVILTDGPGGVSAEDAELYLSVVAPPRSRASRSWGVMEKALHSLVPDGELRINGHCMEMRALAAVLLYAQRSDILIGRVTMGRHSIAFHRWGEGIGS